MKIAVLVRQYDDRFQSVLLLTPLEDTRLLMTLPPSHLLSLSVQTLTSPPPRLSPQVMGKAEHIINGKKVDPKKAKARHGKIFVGGLKPEMSDDDIKNHFSAMGTVCCRQSCNQHLCINVT